MAILKGVLKDKLQNELHPKTDFDMVYDTDGKTLKVWRGEIDSAVSQINTTAESFATTDYVDGKVSDLVDSAPETLDTLKELATALGEDANFSATVTTKIGEAKTAAEGAQSTADTAVANAATAQSKADKAETDAATAQGKAEKAESDAAKAQAEAEKVDIMVVEHGAAVPANLRDNGIYFEKAE